MLKKLSVIFLLICSVILLCACDEEETTGVVIQAYYVNNEETKVEVHDMWLKTMDTDSQIKEVLDGMTALPEKLEYKPPLALGFSLLSHHLENGTLVLNMGGDYLSLEPTTEILVRAALVSTLTQIENVNYVSITVAGNPLYDNLGKLVGSMKAEQFINNTGSEIGNYETANLTLYFTNEEGNGLIAVNRKKVYNSNISLDRLVVEELIAGPSGTLDGVYPTINPDTKPVSVMTKDGVCYVNLNAAFLTQVYNATADVVIYSIVNSLVELSNVYKVQISINGDTSGVYREKYSFTTVFERNLDLVTVLNK